MKPFSLVASVAVVIMLASCEKPAQQSTTALDLSKEELIKRGKYIVNVSACHDCHSPKVFTAEGPEPDTTRLLSGHPKDEAIPALGQTPPGWALFSPGLTASRGPWGISFAANLTPDDTGIGNWTFEQFKNAIRKGKYKGLEGSRPLMPPMPWQMYRNFTDDDLLAVFTYLQSLKPVNNLVPTNITPDKMQFIQTSYMINTNDSDNIRPAEVTARGLVTALRQSSEAKFIALFPTLEEFYQQMDNNRSFYGSHLVAAKEDFAKTYRDELLPAVRRSYANVIEEGEKRNINWSEANIVGVDMMNDGFIVSLDRGEKILVEKSLLIDGRRRISQHLKFL